MPIENRYDVVIIGAGFAGLTLARQLLLESDKTVLLLDRLAEIPPERQKVGESCVQVQGHYMGKILDLEEVLQRDHYMKYNLRFLWKSEGRTNDDIEDYSQSYIRTFSNIACYQMDRNRIEEELLRLNRESQRFELLAPAQRIEFDLEGPAPHRVSFEIAEGRVETQAEWLIDATGRAQLLAKRMGLQKKNQIRHGSSFLWVDGLINLEKLTKQSARDIRLRTSRQDLGHVPQWLATNHFFDEGLWFWVIPLPGKTSLGLVYDRAVVDEKAVSTPEGLMEWVCDRFPLFAADLPHRKVLDHGFLRDFSFGCRQTISSDGWAITGEAGRFSDPLYSPGGDLIALHNTLIVDAILTEDKSELDSKCQLHESLLKAMYDAYLPSYSSSYCAVGDPETFALKYTWELTIYFAFYVFPFVNELFTDRRFATAFLTRFAKLGRLNASVQRLLVDFYNWKKEQPPLGDGPRFHDFMEIPHLRKAEESFYRIGVTVDEARSVLDDQLENLRDLANFIHAHVAAVMQGQPELVTDHAFVASLDLDAVNLEAKTGKAGEEEHSWSFDPSVLDKYRTVREPDRGGPPRPESIDRSPAVR